MSETHDLSYWANYRIDQGNNTTRTPKEIAEDAAQIIHQNFGMTLDAAMGMILAAGRAVGEAGLIVDPYTNAYYQFCLMVTEESGAPQW